MPLHLEEHLDTANIEGSEVPEDLPKAVEWRFDKPQPDWKPVKPIAAELEAVKPVRTEDALRLPLTMKNSIDGPRLIGAIYVKLPNLSLQEWAYVEIRARTRDPMLYMGLLFNYTEVDVDFFPFYRRTGCRWTSPTCGSGKGPGPTWQSGSAAGMSRSQ